ncbi:MAG: Nif3-like dinuclear metal center hexameric protein [Buchnera aphidicola (Schlechtendalia chinensis)]
MKNTVLENVINKKLNSAQFNDCIPNGLQIEGSQKIKKIITGVTACQELLNIAVKKRADAVIVHHGYFWNNSEKTIKGMLRIRIKTILENNINLYCWHLPLDYHPKLGNNVQIGKMLDIKLKGYILPLVPWGILKEKVTAKEMIATITKRFGRIPFHYECNASKKIMKVAWCSGKGQSFINAAAQFGIDAFLTGEVSEETIHVAKENNFHFFSIGHHASECGGIIALTEWIRNISNLDITFINVYNPV